MLSTAVVEDEIDGDLEFLSELLTRARARSSDTDYEATARAVEAVGARRRDPNLYLAVIGEFSSGKSSFINVLLGERLLRTSARPNTAAVTAIRHGTRHALTVRFDGDDDELVFPSAALERKLAQFDRTMETFEQVLEALTVDASVAQSVRRVTVEHPSPLFGEEVVVLDTPGLSSLEEAHAAAAMDAINRHADGFVVLLPSDAPISMRFLALLSEHLRPYLHRTTFVLTRMHHVDEDERAELIEVVERRLRDDLGVAAPRVVPVALGEAMRALESGQGAAAPGAEWLRAFEDLRAELVARLKSERTITIAEHVITLLRAAMEQVESSLRAETEALEQRGRELAHETPGDLADFCAKQSDELERSVQRAVAKARSDIMAIVTQHEHVAFERIHSELDAATTAGGLNTAVAGVPKVIERSLADASRRLAGVDRALKSSIYAETRRLDQRFQAKFHGLDRLAGTPFKPTSGSFSPTSLGEITADALAAQRQLDEDGPAGAIGGAALGAMVGTIVPGIGTVIGAAVGSLIGGITNRTKVPARRDRYRAELQPKIRAVFEDLRADCTRRLDAQAAEAAKHVKGRVEGYRARYEETIKQLRKAHASDDRKLRSHLKQAKNDSAAVASRVSRPRRTADEMAPIDRRTRV